MSLPTNTGRHALRPLWNRLVPTPLGRDKADTLLVLLVSFCVLLPHFSHLPLVVSAGCGILLVWRTLLTLHGRELPRKSILGTIVIVSMGAIWWSQHNVLGRDTGVIMLTLLLTLKLLEMHARRDFMVVMMLAYFLLVTTFFYTQSIPMAALVLVDTGLLLSAQVTFQAGDGLPRLRQRLKYGFAIMGLALPLTLLLFVVFPRIQGPLWGTPDPLAGQTGISDTMTPGAISSLAQSEDIAFRVRFDGPVPVPQERYWRANVLTDYDGFTWRRADLPMRHSVLNPPPGLPLVRQDITQEPTQQHWLMALEVPLAPPDLPGKSNPPQRAFISGGNEILTRLPITQRIRYEVISAPGLQITEPLTSLQTRMSLRLPPGSNPRTRQLAETWRSQAKPDAQGDTTLAIVAQALAYFRQQPFSYTLSPPPLPDKNGMDTFLFETRMGFCEHFSSAFTVLMRAAGIPARVVSGYQGGKINPVDGMLEVRQSDAHAWSEVWVEGRGWLRVDPTAAVAPERILHGLNAAVPRRGYAALGGLLGFDGQHGLLPSTLQYLREHLDAINNRWNQMVLNYNPQQQQSLFERLGINDWNWRSIFFGLISFGIALFIAWWLPGWLDRPRADRLDALYSTFCRRMARRGWPRAMHEPPRTYGSRLASDAPLDEAQRHAVLEFTLLYDQARYRAPSADTGTGANLPQTLRLLLKSLR